MKQAGRDFKGLCPFHQEKTPSFNVRPAEQYFRCFGCGKGGDVFTFVMEINSVDFREARQILADRAGIATDRPHRGTSSSPSRSELVRANRWALEAYRRALRETGGGQARAYLAGRGFTDDSVGRFELGYAPDSFDFLLRQARRDRIPEATLLAAGLVKKREQSSGCYDVFRNRLMFPIIDPAQRVLGFGGRTLGDDPAKYLNTPETALFSKRRCLYGLQHTRRAFDRRGRAVLVEGYTDVIMAHQHGFEETVATLGTVLTEEHATILRRYVPHILLVFDGDEAGAVAAERGLHIALKAQVDVSLARVPGGRDPCEFLKASGPPEFDDLLNSALSALEFKWNQALRAHHDGRSGAARLQAIREFVAFVAASEAMGSLDPIERGVLVNRLAELVGASPQEVARQIDVARQGSARMSATPRSGAVVSDPQPSPRPRTVEEAATLDILAVVLCEPEHYPQAAEVFDPELLGDDRLQRIARTTVALIEKMGTFAIADLLQQLGSPCDTALALELRERAQAAGQLTARRDTAVERLRTMDVVRLSAQATQAWMTGSVDPDPQDRDRRLAELHDTARAYASAPNFAGIRQLRVAEKRS